MPLISVPKGRSLSIKKIDGNDGLRIGRKHDSENQREPHRNRKEFGQENLRLTAPVRFAASAPEVS